MKAKYRFDDGWNGEIKINIRKRNGKYETYKKPRII